VPTTVSDPEEFRMYSFPSDFTYTLKFPDEGVPGVVSGIISPQMLDTTPEYPE
jgi:hypothetical protein